MKYRKKPVVIEAVQWWPGKQIEGVCQSARCEEARRYKDFSDIGGYIVPHIHTLEGLHLVSPGDYIITGVRGERYPCKPDIFEETYEAVGEAIIASVLADKAFMADADEALAASARGEGEPWEKVCEEFGI